ncbi:MAG: hypothetical protein HY273_02755 [Gammaproteobacteria bacterium]|nr:hypothetical protein [Gammaproteobacteria bacterium]
MKPPRKSPHAAPRTLSKPASAPAPTERAEVKYHGAGACLGLWNQRPKDILRVYVERARLADFSSLLKWCSMEHTPYHVVDKDDLEKLTETVHHGGICILALESRSLTFSQLRVALRDNQNPQLVIYLDGVENPHNLGAMLRTCAHFGVQYVLGAQGSLPRLSPSACRIAEGCAEYVRLIALEQPLLDLRELANDGFQIVGTSVSQGTSVYAFDYPQRTILVFGAETVGMSRELRELTQQVLRVPGSAAVESLNVSVACGIFTSEFYRRHVATKKPVTPPGHAAARPHAKRK